MCVQFRRFLIMLRAELFVKRNVCKESISSFYCQYCRFCQAQGTVSANKALLMLRIGIVAGEMSGDAIAADLILAIKKQHPDAVFEGIAGPKMKATGCLALFDSERLSVMAITEVLARLPELLSIRKRVYRHFKNNPPDVFIGVDAPDFNLVLERKLKSQQIPVVHYISPSVWAWRQYRVKKIAKSLDLMLTLLPFEMEFYKKHHVPTRFVGHPMADQIPLDESLDASKRSRIELQCDEQNLLVALLPGSRHSEVQRLLPLLLDMAEYCVSQYATSRPLSFLIPAATEALKEHICEFIAKSGKKLPLKVTLGKARTVMQAADIVVLASGTATLEAMLLKRPMIVTYKVSRISYRVMKMLSNVDHVALPNFFGNTRPVPELLQDDATPENLGNTLLHLLDDKALRDEMCRTFRQNHIQLQKNASQQAADAVLALVSASTVGKQ